MYDLKNSSSCLTPLGHQQFILTLSFDELNNLPLLLVFMCSPGIITFAKAWRNKCFRALFVSICILIFLASIFLAFAIRRHIGVKRPAATKVKKPQPKVEEGPYRRQTMPHLQICSDQVLNDHYVDNSGFTVANPSEFAMVSISTSSPDSVHI